MTEEIKKRGVNADLALTDDYIINYLRNNKDFFDIIIISGARDKNLKKLCENIINIYES